MANIGKSRLIWGFLSMRISYGSFKTKVYLFSIFSSLLSCPQVVDSIGRAWTKAQQETPPLATLKEWVSKVKGHFIASKVCVHEKDPAPLVPGFRVG